MSVTDLLTDPGSLPDPADDVPDGLDDDELDQEEELQRPEPAQPAERPATVFGGGVLGTCKVCGGPARNSRATYCELDKPAASKTRATKAKRTAPGAAKQATPKLAPKRTTDAAEGKKPSEKEWTSFLADVLGYATAALAVWLVSDEPAATRDDQAEELAMDDDEATAIAAPFARLVAGSSFSVKHGRKVLDNLDILDASVAGAMYVQRVAGALNNKRTRRGSTMRSTPIPTAAPRRRTDGKPADSQAGATNGADAPVFALFGPGSH